MPWVQDELPLENLPSTGPEWMDTPDCPDYVQGKHGNCGGDSWDNIRDRLAPCPCAVRGH